LLLFDTAAKRSSLWNWQKAHQKVVSGLNPDILETNPLTSRLTYWSSVLKEIIKNILNQRRSNIETAIQEAEQRSREWRHLRAQQKVTCPGGSRTNCER